jgi:23S rRNA (cytidine1920-2'-O)/16S rRNA (cytidine1409-2'-O)-methyltransferase
MLFEATPAKWGGRCSGSMFAAMNAKMRLDQALVSRGLVPTRARALDLIKRGFVRVGGRVCDKPSLAVLPEVHIDIAGDLTGYVSRGAEKLVAALDAFSFDVQGRTALDVGASTGGFTQILVARGARRVYAVDVGHGQLHGLLRDDPRVVSLEGVDAREISAAQLGEPIDALVADVSFVSVTKVLAPALALAKDGAWLVVLVKPQFEVGRDHIGRGGIVRDEEVRQAALKTVLNWLVLQPGWRIVGHMPSPILGGSGNAEYLLGARRDG